MKIRKNTVNNKPLLVILAIVLVLLVGSGVTYALFQPWNNQESQTESEAVNDVDYDKATQDQIDNGADIKEDVINNDTPTLTNNLSLTISSFKKDPSTYHIGVDIAQLISSGGCKVTLSSPNKQSKTYTSDIQALPGYSTCKGFDIPLSELQSVNWTIEASVTSGSSNGTAKGEVTI